MKKLLLSISIALSVSACTVVPFTSPGVDQAKLNKGKEACKNDGGLHVVSPSYMGYTAFCENKAFYIL